MEDQKLENLLNLALDSTESERLRSDNLNVGYDTLTKTWEVIIKYTGNLEEVRRTAKEVTELFGGFILFYSAISQSLFKTGSKKSVRISENA